MKEKAKKVLAWLVIYIVVSLCMGVFGKHAWEGFVATVVLAAIIASLVWAVRTLSDDRNAS